MLAALFRTRRGGESGSGSYVSSNRHCTSRPYSVPRVQKWKRPAAGFKALSEALTGSHWRTTRRRREVCPSLVQCCFDGLSPPVRLRHFYTYALIWTSVSLLHQICFALVASTVASALVMAAPGDDLDHLRLASEIGCSALYLMLYQSCRSSAKLKTPVAEAVLNLLQDADDFMSATRR